MEVTAIFKGINNEGKIISKKITIDFDPSKYIVKKIDGHS